MHDFTTPQYLFSQFCVHHTSDDMTKINEQGSRIIWQFTKKGLLISILPI